MSRGVFKIFVDETSRAFSKALPQYGFGALPNRSSNGAFRRWWSRSLGWKTDVIEIVYRRGGETRVIVNFKIWFPIYPEEYPIHHYSGCGVATSLIPQFFAKWRVHGYAKKVLRSVLANVQWFDQFSTPRQCLEQMVAMTHGGARKGSPVYEEMLSYLSKVVGKEAEQNFFGPTRGQVEC